MNADELEVLVASESSEDNFRAFSAGAEVSEWLALMARRPDLRVSIAHYQKHPKEIYEALARDENRRVRWALTVNMSTPEVILEALSRDPDDGVRLRVASHPHVPAAVLATMINDQDERVAEKAKARLVLLNGG